MEKIVIQGGKRLKGSVRVSGAKNAALPIMAASLLTKGWHQLREVPSVVDVRTMGRLLQKLGAKIEEEGEALRINTENLDNPTAPYDLVKTMRASILVLGGLLARCGQCRVSLPGGCAIGERPIDQHLMGLRMLGAELKLRHGYIEGESRRLKGAQVLFGIPTVTGTENVLMAATLAEGTTTIHNAAREPEVVELARVLNTMGGRIEGAGTDIITVEGVKKLHPLDHLIMPDRIEAGTFMVSSAITGGDIYIENCPLQYMNAVVGKLTEAGVSIQKENERIRVRREGELRSVNVKALPYPGFPTDMQAQFMALMTLGDSNSVISEEVFEKRFMHVGELKRMGADITLEGHSAVVKGVKNLSGAAVMATDLRASASLILAGLAAEGKTEVSRIYHLDRGYERLDEKLRSLGADIKRVKE